MWSIWGQKRQNNNISRIETVINYYKQLFGTWLIWVCLTELKRYQWSH